MKSKTVIVSFCLLSSFVQCLATNGISKRLIKRAVRHCCAPEFRSCCLKSIEFKESLNCGSEQETWRMVDCLHQWLYGHSTTKDFKFMPFNKILCCETFGQNLLESRNVCKDECMNAMLSPSQDYWHKMLQIHGCGQGNQISCFEMCIQSEKNVVQMDCEMDYWLKPGETYIGEEV